MIVGFSQIKDDIEVEKYDYVSVLYPVGVFSEDCFLFLITKILPKWYLKVMRMKKEKSFLKL